MKFRPQRNDILACGKGFLHAYDLTKQSVSVSLRGIKKDQIVSCVDVPSLQSENIHQTQHLAALGFYDKSVRLFSVQDGSEVTQIKVPEHPKRLDPYRRHHSGLVLTGQLVDVVHRRQTG
jgi:hypothetical protein